METAYGEADQVYSRLLLNGILVYEVGMIRRLVLVVAGMLAAHALGCGSGSDGGGNAVGGSGGSVGSGGSPSGGAQSSAGSVGASGSPGSVTAANTIDEKCLAGFDNYEAQCPTGEDPTGHLYSCQDGYTLHTPTGCGAQWEAYVLCQATAPVDCMEENYVGCTDEQDSYFACQSQFVVQTGCTRLESQDGDRCTGATPYGFGCLGTLPANCVQDPEAATVACCSTFFP